VTRVAVLLPHRGRYWCAAGFVNLLRLRLSSDK
jgi:hypothetical protein